MANQYNNKIILGNETLIDLTGDTATEDDVSNGAKFHLSSGASAVGKARNVAFATCKTAAATKDKVATVTSPGTFSLSIGQIVAVKFTNTNTYSATADSHITLNVNGTGAKQIYYGNTGSPTGANTTAFGRANYTNLYIYDGTYWVWIGSSTDNDTTYSVMSVAEGTTGTATSARLISAKNLKEIIDAREIGVHRVTFSGISSLPQTISDPKVLDAMEITTIEVSNPAAMASVWTVTPADGSVTLSGSLVSGKTTNVIVKLSHAF